MSFKSTCDNFDFTIFETFKNLRKINVTIYILENKEFTVFKSTCDNFDFIIFEIKNLRKTNTTVYAIKY